MNPLLISPREIKKNLRAIATRTSHIIKWAVKISKLGIDTPDRVDIPLLVHDTRLRKIYVKMTNN